MATHHPNARSLIYTLSDFWTLYFKDLPTLEAMYEGVEIDIGQTYLDLLTLMLNISTQDMTLFNKEFFKLLRLREDAITYGGDLKYGAAVGTDVASLRYVNNKVFAVTASLEAGIDFVFDESSRSLLFDYDPFCAYKQRTFGIDNGAFTVTSRRTGSVNDLITINLVDDGTNPPTLARSEYAFTINYDGPAHTRLTTVNTLVTLINQSIYAQGLLQATIAGLGTGTSTVAATGGPVALQRAQSTPLEGYATRQYDVTFGTVFTEPSVTNWLLTDVQKGDVLRLFAGPSYGTTQEFPIALVRPSGLYLYPQAAPVDTEGLDYAILRSPADDWSYDEPFNRTGQTLSCGTNCTVTAATRTLYVPTTPLPFEPMLVGDVIELAGLYNSGEYRIAEVLDAHTVVIEGRSLIDETNITATLYSNLYDAETDGTITDNGDGTSTLSAPSSYLPTCLLAAVIRLLKDGVITNYEVVTVIDPNTLIFKGTVSYTTGFTYSLHPYVTDPRTLAFSPPVAFPVPGTVSLTARRMLDGAQVMEGRDYTVDYDFGIVTPLTIWRTSITDRISYQYRNVVLTSVNNAIQSGSVGTLSGITTFVLTDPFMDTSVFIPGYALKLSNTFGEVNDGWYYVANILSPTSVVLAPGHDVVLPEANNGSITWSLFRRGAIDVTDTVETVTELGAWATDVRVDKYHLYYTYGYLINRVQRSSEEYRALIRGIFQLFMLGPTLERFEAAINTVAGLETIRDDGEILLAYGSGADRSGADGVFDSSARTFTSATAAFTPDDLRFKIYVASGYNANKVFTIQSVLGPTTVVLVEAPTSDTAVSWELTATATHSITTTRATYTYPRVAPLKSKYLTASNWGSLSLSAFEVVTSAFEVTDYVESPFWWEWARIPQTLLPAYSSTRRQSAPKLYENVINPADEACIGDPGFYIGVSDTGVAPVRVALQSGTGDGTLTGDPLYPARTTEVFFSSPTLALTANDLGNLIEIAYPDAGTRYLIVDIPSSTTAKLRSYTPIPYPNVPNLDWSVVNGTLPMRHKAAYVILDKYLKRHLFTVRFDGFLLDKLPANVIQELQDLVFVAKPSYTYLIFSPTTIFDDVVLVQEQTVTVSPVYQMSGRGGAMVQANDNMLTIGEEWVIGSWYRYVSEPAGSFATPTGLVNDVLGVAPANYQRRVQSIYVDPLTLPDPDGNPIQPDRLWPCNITACAGEITAVDGDTATFTATTAIFEAWMALLSVTIDAPATNAGTYRIGTVLSATEVSLYAPGASLEAGLTGTLFYPGYVTDGATKRTAFGETIFVSNTPYDFTLMTTGKNYFLRRPFVSAALQRGWQIYEAIDANTARLATFRWLGSYTGADLTGGILTSASVFFSSEMTFLDRYTANAATSKERVYYAWLTSGPNAGEIRPLNKFFAVDSVSLGGAAVVDDPSVSFNLYYLQHYPDLVPETGGAWEHVERVAYTDNDYPGIAGNFLIDTPTGAGLATYAAYGVQEPTVPIVATFDATQGDTYYVIGGQRPYLRWARPRTGRDMDLEDAPLTIRVI